MTSSNSSTEPTRNDVLAAVAEAIYGPDWVSPLARRLGVSVRTAQRWKSRQTEVPQSALDALREPAFDAAEEHMLQGQRLSAWARGGELIDLEEAAERDLARQEECDVLWSVLQTTIWRLVTLRQPLPCPDRHIERIVRRLMTDDPKMLSALLSYDSDELHQYLPSDYVPVAINMANYTTDDTPGQDQLDG